MRLLCVAEAYPWPPRGGYELRLAHQIEALRSLGDVDVLCLDGAGRVREPAPDGVRVLDAPESAELPAWRWLSRWATTRLPRRLLRRDFGSARALIPKLVAARYDAVLYCHVDGWLATHDLVSGPGLLDFDNLEHLAVRGRRAIGPEIDGSEPVVRRLVARIRWLGVSALDRADEGRWDRIQRSAATTVEATIVCSDLDVGRSGATNAVCIPNGYESANVPADHVTCHDPTAPVFLFVGLMGYPPNSDAVRWFATDVFPRIRAVLPGARFRAVGRNAESISDLDGSPGVEVVGMVDDLDAELRGADVSVVPIRFGAGTRLKVVEAMANRLPIVSTTVGAEGIDVVDGRHVLIADESDDFANACVNIVSSVELRQSLADAAEALYLDTYQWSAIRARLAVLVSEVAASTTPG